MLEQSSKHGNAVKVYAKIAAAEDQLNLAYRNTIIAGHSLLVVTILLIIVLSYALIVIG